MKCIPIIIAVLLLSSFAKINLQTDIQKQHLKGKVKSIIYYSLWAENDTNSVIYFNSIGNITEETYFSQGGKNADIAHFTYDAQNILIEKKSTSWRTAFSYDVNNNLVETNRYKVGEGSLTQRVLFKYDSKGNDSEIVSYDGFDGSMSYYMFIFIASNGDRQEISYNANGKITGKEEYTYDTNHFFKTHKNYENFWDIERIDSSECHYENYDKEGNWTISKTKRYRINLKDGVPVKNSERVYEEIGRRTIEYY